MQTLNKTAGTYIFEHSKSKRESFHAVVGTAFAQLDHIITSFACILMSKHNHMQPILF